MPRWNILRAEAHLLSNYSSSGGEVAYLLVEAHRACSASWEDWHWGRGDGERWGFDADFPSGDMESKVKFTNGCCQSLFLSFRIATLSILTVAEPVDKNIESKNGNFQTEACMHWRVVRVLIYIFLFFFSCLCSYLHVQDQLLNCLLPFFFFSFEALALKSTVCNVTFPIVIRMSDE